MRERDREVESAKHEALTRSPEAATSVFVNDDCSPTATGILAKTSEDTSQYNNTGCVHKQISLT